MGEGVMQIKVVDGGFLYREKCTDSCYQVADGAYFYRNDIDKVLSDVDCDGVDYTPFCNGRTLSDAQQETADFILQNKRCFVFNGMGTGKTMSSLMAILTLHRINPRMRFLIISSKTVLASGWVPEVNDVCPYFPIKICDGSQKKKKEIIENQENLFVGCSADSLHIIPPNSFDVIIADEATLFKGAQGINGTNRGKNMCELASDRRTQRLILMTGTPRAHNCMDAYGLYYVMNDKQRKANFMLEKAMKKGDITNVGNLIKPVLNKSAFRNAMCVPMSFQEYMICKSYKTEEAWNKWKYSTANGIFSDLTLDRFRDRLNHASRDAINMWIERPNANETLLKLLSPAIAFRTEDVLDLPDCPIVDVRLEMNEADKKTLNRIKKEMVMDFADREDIIANKMVLEGKMEQMNCGLVYDADGNGRIMLPGNYNQTMAFIIKHVMSLPKDRGLVIASRYNHILYAVYKAIEIVLGEGTVNIINGAVSSKQRTAIVNDFRSLKTRILLANTACLSHGVTLVEAKEMILLDTPQYAEPYIQVKGRVHRRGQKWEIPIYRIIGNATVGRRFDILEGAEERDDDFVRLVTEDE